MKSDTNISMARNSQNDKQKILENVGSVNLMIAERHTTNLYIIVIREEPSFKISNDIRKLHTYHAGVVD
eukprot:403352062